MLTAGLSEEGQPVFHTLILKSDPRQRCEAWQAAQGHHHKAQRPVESAACNHLNSRRKHCHNPIIQMRELRPCPMASQSVGLKPGFHATPGLIIPHTFWVSLHLMVSQVLCISTVFGFQAPNSKFIIPATLLGLGPSLH